MLYMENWTVCAPADYSLGFEGDHLANVFELTAQLPEGWDLKMDVEQEGEKNIIQLEREGNVFSAPLTEGMLTRDGTCFLQIRGTKGDMVRHSNIFLAMVHHSVNASQAFPSPLPSEFEQIERRISGLNQHPPMPGEGVWLIWNGVTEQYEPSEIPFPSLIVSPDILRLQVLDQAQYDALSAKDSRTLYLIRG